MTCYFPTKAYRTPHGSDNAFTFNASQALNPDNPIPLPCGRCQGCRQDKSDEWALRCSHEAQMHQANSFVTLTYADDHLPADYSLSKRVVQLFNKRLRKRLAGKIKIFAAGEYGPLDMRPHYHLLIFGWDFHADRKFFKNTAEGPLYTSEQLSEAWQHQGFCTVGSVSYKSAKYCTGYIFDKQYDDKAKARYLYNHPVTGQVVHLQPEFSLKSGGLGSSWYDKFKDDCFPSDFLVVDGREVAVPRYYRLKLSEEETKQFKQRHYPHPLKADQVPRDKRLENNSPARLRDRAEIHNQRLKRKRTSL